MGGGGIGADKFRTVISSGVIAAAWRRLGSSVALARSLLFLLGVENNKAARAAVPTKLSNVTRDSQTQIDMNQP